MSHNVQRYPYIIELRVSHDSIPKMMPKRVRVSQDSSHERHPAKLGHCNAFCVSSDKRNDMGMPAFSQKAFALSSSFPRLLLPGIGRVAASHVYKQITNARNPRHRHVMQRLSNRTTTHKVNSMLPYFVHRILLQNLKIVPAQCLELSSERCNCLKYQHYI